MGLSQKVITLDGPAGSGKSSVAKQLAAALNMDLLNSGLIYRALTLHCLQNDVDMQEGSLAALINGDLDIDISRENDGCHMWVNKVDVTDLLRSKEVTDHVSQVASLKVVREWALPLQRKQVGERGLVADGRDMATVVFPTAEYKFYLDASAEVRARRRLADSNDASAVGKLQAVIDDINRRDKQDSEREVAPLKQADDAIYIDSSEMSLAAVIEAIKGHISN